MFYWITVNIFGKIHGLYFSQKNPQKTKIKAEPSCQKVDLHFSLRKTGLLISILVKEMFASLSHTSFYKELSVSKFLLRQQSDA